MNILITSAGRRSYLVRYFREALAGKGLVHAGNSVYSAALQVADKAVITPLIYNPQYICFLIDYCRQNDIAAIISVFDIDLPMLAKSKEIFNNEGIQVVVSDYEVTQICNDKWNTYKFLRSNSIKTPSTFLGIDDAVKGLKAKYIEFPVIIKPRRGMGSMSIYEAENMEELHILFKRVRKEIFNTYLSYESELCKEDCVIIQEKIKGQEYGLDVVNDLHKNYVTSFLIKANSMRGGETDWAITEKNVLFDKLGKRLSTNLQHVANLNVDCFMHDKKPYVLEMNCRFGGHYPFFHLAGANLPLAIIKWLNGEFADKELFEIRDGVEGIKDIDPIVLKS